LNLRDTLNYYGKHKTPFFFCINYDLTQWEIHPLATLPKNIKYEISNNKNFIQLQQPKKDFISFRLYKKQFDKIISQIKAGNTYLLNLTASTPLNTNYTFDEIFASTNAKYKLRFKDKFVSFSPETFVTICNNTISTFPMKGTIDASITNAKDVILNDKKEFAEHVMIVDLLRNDLNIVSKNVRVDKFRYIDKINAGEKKLFQVSSKISGDLDINWHEKIGDILLPMLPAGSISGTPKKMTLDIIREVEEHKRDFFTGVWGVYDGNSLDSAVLIRFIENSSNGFIYKSGGGITLDSDPMSEYDELKAKVYLP